MLEKNNTDIEDIVINMLSGEKLSPEEENVLTKRLKDGKQKRRLYELQRSRRPSGLRKTR